MISKSYLPLKRGIITIFKTGLNRLILYLILQSLVFIPLSCSKVDTSKSPHILHFVTWRPNQPHVWDEVIRMFEAEHPDIKVVREFGPHSSTQYHDLLTQKLKNRDTNIDVFFMDVIWPPEFAAARWAEPLDEYFSPEEQEKFLKATILANTYRGSIYGMPLFIDSGLLYYRKDLLEKYGFKPPEIWEELVSQAETVMNGERRKNPDFWGYSGQFKQYEGLVCDMLEFIMSNGGSLIDLETGEPGLDKKPAIEAIKFVRDRIIGRIAPRGVLTYQEPESLALFVQGKALFMRNWPYAWEVSNNPERSRIVGKVGIARLPHFRGGRSFSTLGGWQLGINHYSKQKEIAWRFVEFLSGEKVQRFLALKASLAPTRKALYSDPDILRINPQFRDMKDVFITAYPRPRSPFYPSLSQIFQEFFSSSLSIPDSDIERLSQDAARKLRTVIKRFSEGRKKY